MQVPKVGFLCSAVQLEQLPKYSFPEVAFAGRSNVGKSSLLNALVFQRNLARVSATPGRTQSINIYPVDGKWMLVDLPGYGYARVSKQQREEFRKLILGYLLGRPNLVLACVLVDSRHDPTADDTSLLEELELHQRRFAVVLTKCDALSSQHAEERIAQLRHLVHQCSWCMDVVCTSARTGQGRSQLWALIHKALRTYHSPLESLNAH
ncbi:MAG: ribosome biogenesis GTP-binding protein YihA/YsxC [Bacteroidota bacterium]|nr:ribosome biogenesis GTP-binding protein YihA/YsxC [Candidatus Kapabacteria bacterium]MCS7302368.1 ribosome biogenesis GTP-binding protein YihA/YsxC [Candidatus Kapabacteria bacterium]MCX7936887.1 ribosome biogenesis GTP-binding protein YihA/YsxC [Chlorobiota bacterium]MDW8075334.1 ribosome biogenesis GTP-binding protein YihA/YsxC [Bacteroidota bacterium]MDW8271946.1 ribosome biogenesis GTP-binding protein YihA/YsxC [Bacteroidota bacterium]